MYIVDWCTRHYIALARQKRPTVPPHVSAYVVDSYVRLRKQSKDDEQQAKSHSYTSARTLLGVLRLAQALARLRLADTVERPDVDEALRLMECSKASLQEDNDKDYEPDKSAVSQIFRLIKGMVGSGGRPTKRPRQKRFGRGPGRERDMDVDSDAEDDQELSMVDIRARVIGAGFTEVQLMDTISQVFTHFSILGGSLKLDHAVRRYRYLGSRCWWIKITLCDCLIYLLHYSLCIYPSSIPVLYPCIPECHDCSSRRLFFFCA